MPDDVTPREFDMDIRKPTTEPESDHFLLEKIRGKALAIQPVSGDIWFSMPPAPLLGSVIREVFLYLVSWNLGRKEPACAT